MSHRAVALLCLLLFVVPPCAASEPFAEVPIDPWGGCSGGEDDDDDDDCDDERPCVRIATAWTSASQPQIDLYIARLVDTEWNPLDPGSLNADRIAKRLADRILDRVKDAVDEAPDAYEMADGDLYVQVEVRSPAHEDPEVDGIRLTVAVDIERCLDA